MKHLFSLAGIMAIAFAIYRTPVFAQNTPKNDLQNQQILVVISGGWDSLKGSIYCFEKRKNRWAIKFSNPVVLGSRGLGMGEGLIQMVIEGAPVKKEGDLKSPAGIFSIGTAFGYASDKDAKWIKNPYIRATDNLIC